MEIWAIGYLASLILSFLFIRHEKFDVSLGLGVGVLFLCLSSWVLFYFLVAYLIIEYVNWNKTIIKWK